nr:acetyltransferase [Haemonchus contortus]
MRLNENTKIVGSKVVLVPYEKEHVLKYHKWMEDEELRRLTGSERLSLDEEYEMQQNWRVDGDKLTFIILSRARLDCGCSEASATQYGDHLNQIMRPDPLSQFGI